MELSNLTRSISDFSRWSHADKVKLFAWFLHTYANKPEFTASDIERCYERLHLSPPSAINPFLKAMVDRRPQDALRNRNGYRLEARIREKFDSAYGQRAATVEVEKLLSELPGRIPDLAERVYLEESLICFKHGAFRASIVMSWNLAFDHLCGWVLKKHLASFNAQLPKSFSKADVCAIGKRDDFTELKESQVLHVCNSANIISSSLYKVLKEKLDRRNLAAHPSGVNISQLTAEEFTKDLIENVVLKLM